MRKPGMPSSKTEKRFIQSRDFIVAEPAGVGEEVGVVDFYVVMNEFEENKLERERERERESITDQQEMVLERLAVLVIAAVRRGRRERA
jgi:hypothetical protein